jgi:hypothetical protein
MGCSRRSRSSRGCQGGAERCRRDDDGGGAGQLGARCRDDGGDDYAGCAEQQDKGEEIGNVSGVHNQFFRVSRGERVVSGEGSEREVGGSGW